jgi:hypothetical protein
MSTYLTETNKKSYPNHQGTKEKGRKAESTPHSIQQIVQLDQIFISQVKLLTGPQQTQQHDSRQGKYMINLQM